MRQKRLTVDNLSILVYINSFTYKMVFSWNWQIVKRMVSSMAHFVIFISFCDKFPARFDVSYFPSILFTFRDFLCFVVFVFLLKFSLILFSFVLFFVHFYSLAIFYNWKWEIGSEKVKILAQINYNFPINHIRRLGGRFFAQANLAEIST